MLRNYHIVRGIKKKLKKKKDNNMKQIKKKIKKDQDNIMKIKKKDKNIKEIDTNKTWVLIKKQNKKKQWKEYRKQ